LAFPSRLAHLNTVVHGIADYARGAWVFTTNGEANDLPLTHLKGWRGDGIIGSVATEADARAARRSKIPVVTFLALLKDPGVPRVMMDQGAIGRLAADHLLSRGFRQFGFYGLDGAGYSSFREAAFVDRLRAEGFPVHRHSSPNMLDGHHRWDDTISGICKWIEPLPGPVGIFAVSDARARMVAEACHMVGRRVPEEVGVIGADNNQFDCELGAPKLSTVECDWRQVGYRVAGLLDDLMNGRPAPADDQLVLPTGVIVRESTDVTIVDQPAVARAAAFARAHLDQCFGVKALVAAARVSRRHLEMAFAESLRRTPAEYLAELRVQRAKALLRSSDVTLSRVARECGFSDLRHFSRVFERVEHASPVRYRQMGEQAYPKVPLHE